MQNQKTSPVIDEMKHLLADSYTVYLKTHNFHWNVTGPMFTTLHTLFETQYTELALAVDEIAERIRALGAYSPGSYAEFAKLTDIKEANGVPNANEMIQQLANDCDTLAARASRVVRAASEVDDDPSADLATRRSEVAQKNAWMLRSHLA